MKKMFALIALTFAGSVASAAPLSKKTYSTPMAAAKAEMARRLDANKDFRQTFSKTGVKGLTGKTLSSSGKTSEIQVTYPGAWAGSPQATVKVEKEGSGYKAVQSSQFSFSGL